jgi:hypothetical protein
MSVAWLSLAAAILASQDAPSTLPAEAPIGGVLWSVVVPALLLVVAASGTFLLYRRFSGEDDQGNT